MKCSIITTKDWAQIMQVEGGSIIRIIIGLVIAGISFLSYLGSQEYNEVTGENQYISMTVQQEIALGLQAAPELIQQYGGLASPAMNDRTNQIGDRIVRESVAAQPPWQFEFNVLNDPQTLNAFALPGGQIFITSAMVNRLVQGFG